MAEGKLASKKLGAIALPALVAALQGGRSHSCLKSLYSCRNDNSDTSGLTAICMQSRLKEA